MRCSAGVKASGGAGKTGERGSALLIVFAFAAMVAIMLYMEMPVAVFEAQRQKEELLIDRGNEYAHAVKLFVRKLGTYPASVDALEKTNQMRFLRHRFKDPFTGKEDWRMLHAGPNGMLIDSKVNPIANNQNGKPNTAGSQNASAGSFGSPSNGNSGSTFGSSSFGSSSFGSSASSSDSTPTVVVPALPQRGPAIAANASGPTASPAEESPLAPLTPSGQAEASATGQPAGNTTGGNVSPTAVPGQPDAGTGGAGPNGAPAGTAASTAGNLGAGANANGAAAQGTPGASARGNSNLGSINSGGIAGVASHASGHTIKTVNDQSDYSLWEFYYDPAKDASRGIANALGSTGAGQPGQGNTQPNGFGTNSSSGNSSSFGSSSPAGTSGPFGSTTPTNTTPTNSGPGANGTPIPNPMTQPNQQ